jgi:hypothetical protein
MNNVTQHIEELKNFQVPEVDRKNKIYFLQVTEKPYIKVGDSIRDVEERNRETMTNAALHRKKGTKPFYVVAEKFDGTTFRDKQFHAFLRKQGYTFELNDQGNESEWVKSDVTGNIPTVEQLLEELAKFTSKPVYKSVELRRVQHYGLDLLATATEAGHTKINFGSCMRSGKTIISLTHAKRNNCMPVYIGKNLTSQSSAEDDNNENNIVPCIVTVSIHGQDEDTDTELSKKSQRVIEKINSANKDNQKIIIYVDECDDASHTAKSRAIIKQVAKHYHDKGVLFQVITMTGTRKERGRKILNDLTFLGKSKDLSIEYWEMQILQPEETVNRNFVSINFFQGNAHGLVNIADALKDRTTGHASLASFIKLLLSPNNFGLKDTSKHPHWFMKFCTTEKSPITDLAKYLNTNLTTVAGKDYLYIPINGDTTSSREAQKFCKKIIKDNPTKVVVFLSFGMATTSFSVVPIGNSAVFSDNSITADDTQAYHRSATWETGKEWCNMVQVTTAEPDTVSWNDVFESELPPGPKQGKLPISKEILHLNSLIHIECGKSTNQMTITSEFAEHVLDKRAVAQTRVASVMHMLKEHDDIKDIILECVDPKTGKIKKALKSGTEKGDTFDPFGVLKNRKKKTTQTGLTVAKQEAILRAFAANAVNVPAVAREQGITLEEFDLWSEVGVDEDLFKLVCEQSEDFKETINTIYRLCDDDSHLKTYLDKTMIQCYSNL